MKKNRGKLFLIIISVLLSFYFLYPTYRDYQFVREITGLTGEDSIKYIEDHEIDIREARGKRLKLGLDLQGGMRVVLEVNVMKLLDDLAKNKDETFESSINEVRSFAKTSEEDILDIFQRKFKEKQIRISRYYGNIRDSDDDVLKMLRNEATGAIDRAMEIVRNRVDQYGVSEPSVQKQGGRRIIVELPGVSKEEEVRQLLQGTALLEFKLLIDPTIAAKVYESIDKVLAGKPLTDTASADTTNKSVAKSDTTQKSDTAFSVAKEEEAKDLERAKSEHPFFALAGTAGPEQGFTGELYTAEENKNKVNRILEQPDIKKLVPADMAFVWSGKSFFAEGKKYYTLFAVKKTAELTGGVIVNARENIDPLYNAPVVNMEMNSDGARDWARITGANIKKRIAIIMDNACFSAPTVQTKIVGGNSQITGLESVEEAKLLAIVLRAGSLPAPVDIIQQTSVGPSLGEDSINKGITSSLLALALTVIFMVVYYRMGGTVADLALLLNLLFILAVLAGFQGTLTLPGIAGMILTMAVAVDANVLIYERIREEAVTGKTLAAAIDTGYHKAFSAIFDSNLTTFITGAILYQFGSGPVQGFALTLMIGIAASMFSALVITRVIFDNMTERGKVVSFG